MKKISIIIPVYNEEKTLNEIVRKVQAVYLPSVSKEIIIIDDASKDKSKEIMQMLAKRYGNIKLIYHEKNIGKGGAIRTGLKNITGNYVVIQDGDLEYNPQEFLINALDSKTKASLPIEVQQEVESEITLQAPIEVFHIDDFDKKESKYIYILDTIDGKSYNLHFIESPPELDSGSLVIAKGIVSDSELVVEDVDVIVPASISIPPLSRTLGNKKVLVMMVKLEGDHSNDADGIPITADRIAASMDTVNLYYQEASFYQISFLTDIVGWYTVKPCTGPGGCSFDTYGKSADEIAKANGMDLDNYNHILYVFPDDVRDGSAVMFGRKARVHGTVKPDIIAHEIGHNLGLDHANTLICKNVAIDFFSKCKMKEYGDPFEIMGMRFNNYMLHINAPHKINLGWIPFTRIQKVTTNGVYEITPLELNLGEVQALEISKPDTRNNYYISFRQQIGFDQNLPTSVTEGVSIHIDDMFPNRRFTFYLDPTPGDGDITNAVLTDGSSFYDQNNEITITQLSHGVNYATVSVMFGDKILQGPDLVADSAVDYLNKFLDAEVYNNGDVFAAEFKIRLQVDLGNDGNWDRIEEELIMYLAPKSKKRIGISIGSTDSGTHRVRFCVDVNNQIYETNEDNNCIEKITTV